MYHADRDKGKCDLHGGRRQGLVEQEGRIYFKIELIDATDKSQRIESSENSIQLQRNDHTHLGALPGF